MFDPKMLETVDHRGGHWQIQRFRDARPGLFEYAVQAGFVAMPDGERAIDEQWLPHSSDKVVEYRKVSPRSRGEDGSLAIGWERRVAPCFRRGEVIRLVDQPDTTMGDSGMRVVQNHPFDAVTSLLRLEDGRPMLSWGRGRSAVQACEEQYRRLAEPRYEPVPGTIWHAGSSYTFVVLSDEGCGISHADDERCKLKTVLFSDGSRGFWAFSSPPREEYRGGLTDEQLAEARAFAENADGATDDLVDSATYAIDELLVTVELDPMPALLARLDTIIELLSDGEDEPCVAPDCPPVTPEPVEATFRVTRLEDGKTIMGDAEVWSGVTRELSITFEDVKIDEHTYELLFGRPQPEPAAPTAVRPGQLWGFTGDDTRLRVRWVEGGHAFLVEERADGTTGEPWAPATKSMLQLSSGYRLLEDTPAGTFYIGSANATDIRSIASVDLP